jgi:hypothetical protein
MAIRWARGFFRLWLILSLIWIALVGWLYATPGALTEYWRTRNIEFALPGIDTSISLPVTSPRDTQRRQVVDLLKQNAPQFQKACRAEVARWEAAGRGLRLLACPSDVDFSSELRERDFERVASELVDIQYEPNSDPILRHQRAEEALTNTVLAMVVPVLGLFAVGASLVWAMRGFSAK